MALVIVHDYWPNDAAAHAFLLPISGTRAWCSSLRRKRGVCVTCFGAKMMDLCWGLTEAMRAMQLLEFCLVCE